MSGWKRGLIDAVDEVLKRSSRSEQGEWRSLGKVVPVGDNSWYALDLQARNGKPLTADSLEQLCLADKQGPDRGTPIPVERTACSGFR
jgi:hypothetical protein